ncbi:hypothetical protein D3C73_1542940 [compost metagenome]
MTANVTWHVTFLMTGGDYAKDAERAMMDDRIWNTDEFGRIVYAYGVSFSLQKSSAYAYEESFS